MDREEFLKSIRPDSGSIVKVPSSSKLAQEQLEKMKADSKLLIEEADSFILIGMKDKTGIVRGNYEGKDAFHYMSYLISLIEQLKQQIKDGVKEDHNEG